MKIFFKNSLPGSLTKSRISRILWICLLFVWMAVSLAALTGMYRLWWQRERIDYLGKDVAGQRTAIWQRAGLPLEVLRLYDRIEQSWLPDISYSISGEHTRRSYLAYLLIPRLPTGSDRYRIDVDVPTFIPDDDLKLENNGRRTRDRDNNTSVLGLAFSLLVVIGIGFLVEFFFRPALGRTNSWLRPSFPELCGAACLMATLFIVLSKYLFFRAEIAFWLLVAISVCGWSIKLVCLGRRRGSLSGLMNFGNLGSKSKAVLGGDWIVPLLFTLIILNVVWSLLMAVVVVPDDWDAWAIWGAKAKVLALTVGPLTDVVHFGHGDYPLLWPSVWALSGWCAGGWEEMWSRGWGSIFFILCLWETAVIIYRLTKRLDTAMLGAALLASIPMAPLISSWSYAEAPFWLMTVSCFGCLLRWRQTGAVKDIVLAGILAAAAAYTKNEGVMFALAALIWLVFNLKNSRPISLFVFVAVFFLLYFPWVYWVKEVAGLSSHAVSGLEMNAENVSRAIDRLPMALEKIGAIWRDLRQWNIVLWAIGGGITLFLLKASKQADPVRKTDLLPPILMLFAYLVIYSFHHDEIYWLVGTSWSRLTLQTLPLIIVVLVSAFALCF